MKPRPKAYTPENFIDAAHGEGPLASWWRDKPHQVLAECAKALAAERAKSAEQKELCVVAEKLAKAKMRELAVERKKNAEWQASFDLYDGAMRRGTKLWQRAHPGRKGVWPDGAKLVVWLITELEGKPPERLVELLHEIRYGKARDAVADQELVEMAENIVRSVRHV